MTEAKRSVLHQLLLDARDGKLTAGRIGAAWTGYLHHVDYDLPKGERSVLGRALWGGRTRSSLIAVDLEIANPGGYPTRQIVKSKPYLTEAGMARLAHFEQTVAIDIERLANEAEAGYSLDRFRPRSRPTDRQAPQ